MPQKDKEETGRERKKCKKDGDKNGIYSSKHIRIMEERSSSQKKNKKIKKQNKIDFLFLLHR